MKNSNELLTAPNTNLGLKALGLSASIRIHSVHTTTVRLPAKVIGNIEFMTIVSTIKRENKYDINDVCNLVQNKESYAELLL